MPIHDILTYMGFKLLKRKVLGKNMRVLYSIKGEEDKNPHSLLILNAFSVNSVVKLWEGGKF